VTQQEPLQVLFPSQGGENTHETSSLREKRSLDQSRRAPGKRGGPHACIRAERDKGEGKSAPMKRSRLPVRARSGKEKKLGAAREIAPLAEKKRNL